MTMRLHAAALVVVGACTLALVSCRSTPPEVSNQASRECSDRGGQQRMEPGPFGEIGVCAFGEKQCEQWAMLRGDCPRGGIPVANFATTLQRHCAIRGGSMVRGTCALPPAGRYAAKASSWFGGERNALLELDIQGGAVLTSTAEGKPPATVRGAWAREGRFMTVFSGKQRIVFRYEGQRLVPQDWDRAAWPDTAMEEFTRQ
jgi:putative hemolysin